MRTILIALLIMLAAPISAQDFQKGLEAYRNGDYATALKEWEPLAERGNSRAQFNLGVMYDEGEGVPQDDKEAVRWYRLAAEQGYAMAQFNLGVMYDDGDGVPQDDKEAVRWYMLAAEQGDVDAQVNLGVMYYNGQGVLADFVLAHMWFNIAAALGDEMGDEKREVISKQMTSEDLSKAEAMARACFNSNYEKCGY